MNSWKTSSKQKKVITFYIFNKMFFFLTQPPSDFALHRPLGAH